MECSIDFTDFIHGLPTFYVIIKLQNAGFVRLIRSSFLPLNPHQRIVFLLALRELTAEARKELGMSAAMPLEKCTALVLNADFRPLSYFPLSVVSWQDAMRAVFRETVTVVSEYERTVRSPTREYKLPSVLALKEYVRTSASPAFTRFNVFLRDQWSCQYCGDKFKTHELTFDHVVPRSRGGRTNWENIVAACRPCNTMKGSRLPDDIGMYPIIKPRRPSVHQLQEHGRKFPPNFLHESWRDFLYWDTELDDD